MILSELNLWDRFRSGDKDALEEIYIQNFDFLLNYGYRYADVDIVKDNIQELFVKLYLHRDNISCCNNIRLYLARSLRNRLLDYKKNKKVELTDRLTSDFVFDIGSEFESEYDDIDLNNIKKVQQIFNNLSSRQREILYLRYIEKLSYKEIADLLHIECQSAKNLFVRSIAKIKELFYK
ncbi:MAG: sigma-70 family RNA polymerase sigma factor [Rikenellaceae bacterium]